jgi:hypothetical protein
MKLIAISSKSGRTVAFQCKHPLKGGKGPQINLTQWIVNNDIGSKLILIGKGFYRFSLL